MSKFPEKSITISFSKGSSCEVDTLLEEASIIEDDSMSKAFSGQILSEINLLLVDKSLWEVFLQEILEAEESEKTQLLQGVALSKIKLDADNTASLAFKLISNKTLSREAYFYCLYILRNSTSRIAFLFSFYATITEQFEHQDCNQLLKIGGVDCFRDTSHANELAELILNSDNAKMSFQSYKGYFKESYLMNNFSFSVNEELFSSVFKCSYQGASSALECLSVCTNPTLIISLTKKYLNLYQNPDLSVLREIVQNLGTLPQKIDDTSKFLHELNGYELLNKHIQKSLYQLERLKSGKAKSYKNPTLRYRSGFIYSCGITENADDIGFLRWQDESERICSSKFSEFEIRECKNKVREEVGLKRIGEGWASETLLYKITSSILSEYGIDVIHHHRPLWLKPQEVDIYFKIDSQEFGIEYQGIQHYKPIKHFGGLQGYEQTVLRDRKKKVLCDKNNLRLLFFKYTNPINEASVRVFLGDILNVLSRKQ